MAKITVNRERCKGCLLCINVCPKGLICADKKLNRRGANPVRFSRRAHSIAGGIPPPDSVGIPINREEAGIDSPECLGCCMCAIICPDSCITVYK